MRQLKAVIVNLLLLFSIGGCFAQELLTLEDALRMAKRDNGTIASAYQVFRANQSSTRASFAAFFPELTPVYRYDTSRSRFYTGPRDTLGNATSTLDLVASFRILDSGQRNLTYLGNRAGTESSRQSALQTLRDTLFLVHQQYYDVIREQELVRVREAQLERAMKTLEQTEVGVELGAVAQKDILQARADALNARASVLSEQTRLADSRARLKATIGWQATKDLPPLQPVTLETRKLPDGLESAFKIGVENRADLRSLRHRIKASKFDVKLAEIDAGVQVSLDAQASKSFAPNVSDGSLIGLFATIPLFDAKRSRELVNARRFNLRAQEESLTQAERNARSEIESAYQTMSQSVEQLEATAAALEAARLNFEAAQEANRVGAADLISVLTAQVSLSTAEANHVEATYNALTAQVRMQLVMGLPVPGENL